MKRLLIIAGWLLISVTVSMMVAWALVMLPYRNCPLCQNPFNGHLL